MKKMAAGSFKANCLAIMDEVQAKHETVVISKYGKPVAKLVPIHTDPTFPRKSPVKRRRPLANEEIIDFVSSDSRRYVRCRRVGV
jgi:prevent-host-death family protein